MGLGSTLITLNFESDPVHCTDTKIIKDADFRVYVLLCDFFKKHTCLGRDMHSPSALLFKMLHELPLNLLYVIRRPFEISYSVINKNVYKKNCGILHSKMLKVTSELKPLFLPCLVGAILHITLIWVTVIGLSSPPMYN